MKVQFQHEDDSKSSSRWEQPILCINWRIPNHRSPCSIQFYFNLLWLADIPSLSKEEVNSQFLSLYFVWVFRILFSIQSAIFAKLCNIYVKRERHNVSHSTCSPFRLAFRYRWHCIENAKKKWFFAPFFLSTKPESNFSAWRLCPHPDLDNWFLLLVDFYSRISLNA